MTEAEAPAVSCPKCEAPLAHGDGVAACGRCGTAVSIANFTPVLSAATLVPGEGRCQAHPAKDAVDACERCGGFVCDVCATRTGEHLYCPSCFDWKHDRKELETTVARRTRWDQMCGSLFLLCLFCNAFLPFAFVIACITLWKRRKEPYLHIGFASFIVVSTVLSVGFVVALIASGVD